jgi:hypothetical protein
VRLKLPHPMLLHPNSTNGSISELSLLVRICDLPHTCTASRPLSFDLLTLVMLILFGKTMRCMQPHELLTTFHMLPGRVEHKQIGIQYDLTSIYSMGARSASWSPTAYSDTLQPVYKGKVQKKTCQLPLTYVLHLCCFLVTAARQTRYTTSGRNWWRMAHCQGWTDVAPSRRGVANYRAMNDRDKWKRRCI